MYRTLVGLLLCAIGANGQATVIDLFEAKLLRQIQDLDVRTPGVLGLAAIDLTTRRTFSYHGETVFPQASSIKIPILIRVYEDVEHGKFRLEDRVTLHEEDLAGGSGNLQKELKNGPLTLTIMDIVKAMIESSDNTATNYLIRRVGMDTVNRWLDRNSFPNTRLQRIMMDSAAAAADRENISTPREMAGIADLLYRGMAVNPAASKKMLDVMRLVKAHFRKALPAGTDIASKPGGIPGVACETGIVFLSGRPFVLSVMTTFAAEKSETVEEAARIVFQHFQSLAAANQYGHRLR
ncbi:MAG: serine hydrolase [Bryobacterales bacterium]|nr:serine hydrolase [Bryobacterales bacterium]